MEEPPAKRRKTIVCEKVVEIQRPSAPIVESVAIGQPVKARKRELQEREDDIKTLQAGPADGEDSFVSELKSKRRAKKEEAQPLEQVISETIFAVEPPVAKSRPRRRAAVTAEAKVIDGFVEENAPVDKKRRDVETAKKLTRARKATVEDTVTARALGLQPEKPIDGVLARRMKTKERAKKRSIDKAAPAVEGEMDDRKAHPVREQQRLEQVIPSESEHASEPAEPLRERRKANTAAPESQLHTSEVAPADLLPLEPTRSQMDATYEPVAKPAGRAKAKVTKAKTHRSTATAMPPLSTVSSPEKLREPLKETQTNLTMRSVSPEKPMKKETATRPKRPRARVGQDGNEGVIQPTGEKRTQRRKLLIERDIPIASDAQPVVEAQAVAGDSVADEGAAVPKILSTASGDHADLVDVQKTLPAITTEPKTTDTKKTQGQTKRNVDRDKKAKPVEHEANVVLDNKTQHRGEDDIDWLFAPLERAQPSKRPAKAQKPSKRRSKLPDMDLDDLLSDIASFAQQSKVDTRPVAGRVTEVMAGGKRKAGRR